MKKPVLVVGSVNLDLVASVSHIPVPGETVHGGTFQTFLGGKGANQAVAVARLGYPVNMIAKVGGDDIGKRLYRGLQDAGVGMDAVAVEKRASSGIAMIATDAQGQNSIVVVPGANSTLLPKDVSKSAWLIRGAGIILTQLETPLETLVHLASLARRHRVPVILDPAPARALPSELLSRISWLTPNETEACFYCEVPSGTITVSNAGAYVEKLLGIGPGNVVIKIGAQGAFLATAAGDRVLIPAFQVRAVDSTAAGDAFNAGFAVALMRGKRPADAARFASAVAALSVMREGAQSSMPAGREVNRFLRHAKGNSVGKAICAASAPKTDAGGAPEASSQFSRAL